MSNGWFKFIVGFFYSLFCLGIALLPEIIMYFVWHLIQPENQTQKIALIAVFIFGGGGLSVLAGVLGFGAWIAGITSLMDS